MRNFIVILIITIFYVVSMKNYKKYFNSVYNKRIYKNNIFFKFLINYTFLVLFIKNKTVLDILNCLFFVIKEP
jgi:hypothetical protein